MKALYVQGGIWTAETSDGQTGVVVIELDDDEPIALGGQLRIEIDGMSLVTVVLSEKDLDLLDDLARDVYGELRERKKEATDD